MAVKLKDDTRARLVDCLIEQLPTLMIENNVFISSESLRFLSALDDILANSRSGTDRAAKAKLTDIIDDRPVADFTYDWLGEALREHYRYDLQAETATLGTFPAFANIPALAQDIVAALEALPLRYKATAILDPKLNHLLAEDKDEVIISPACRLVRVNQAFRDRFPGTEMPKAGLLYELGSTFMDYGARGFTDGSVALQLDLVGFVDRTGLSHTTAEAISSVKAFFGLGLAFGLFKREFSFLGQEARETLLFHRQRDGSLSPVSKREFDHDAAVMMRQTALADPFQAEMTGVTFRAKINGRLNAIAVCFGEGAACAKLRLAGRWYFDSVASRDEISSFVQAVVVLETLLGEADPERRKDLSLGALLKNRCAYLIATTQSERKQIMTTFPRIYEVRSAIVHSGKSRLASTEHDLLSTLRWYCARVIIAEARLVHQDNGSDPSISS